MYTSTIPVHVDGWDYMYLCIFGMPFLLPYTSVHVHVPVVLTLPSFHSPTKCLFVLVYVAPRFLHLQSTPCSDRNPCLSVCINTFYQPVPNAVFACTVGYLHLLLSVYPGDNPVEMGQNIMKDEDLRMAIQVNNVVEVQRILSEGMRF